MQKITPFLWFNTNAEEAMNFYTGIFPDSKIKKIVRYGDTGPGPKGSVMTVSLELNGQEFALINGGPMFTFTEAISFVVNCESQEEVDKYWDQLSESGEKSRCGWLKDKFGLSWQVVPTALLKLLQHEDPVKANQVMQAMMQMDKISIADLEAAAV